MAGTRRGKGNILYLRHIWLDFENGDLRPNEIPDLFPYVRMVVTNTFNNTHDAPRFRVIIPTTQPVLPEAYELLYDCIGSKIEEAGFWIKKGNKPRLDDSRRRKSGLDWPKRAPNSLFFAPCQAEDPKESFFQTYTGPERTTLDPSTWIENSAHLIRPEIGRPDPVWETSPEINQAAADAAIETWRTSPLHPGEGGSRFFRLALDLRSAGMGPSEIEATLRAEAGYGRSPDERKAQIPSIMNSLRNGRGFWQ